MTEREIAEIDDPEAASLSRRERLALAFAETLIALPTAMTDERFAELAEDPRVRERIEAVPSGEFLRLYVVTVDPRLDRPIGRFAFVRVP